MHKKRYRTNSNEFLEDFINENEQQIAGISKFVAEAVTQYNTILPILWDYQDKNTNERFIKEAEEESAKIFLDRVLDFMQRKNIENDFIK